MIIQLNLKKEQIQQELDCDRDPSMLKKYLQELKRNCFKIAKAIANLHDSEGCLKRPFVF